MIGILVPIAFFAMIAVVVVGPRYLKSLERQKMADTLRAAIENGQPLPREAIDLLTASVRPPPSPKGDLRRGVIFVAVALGLVGMALAVGQGEPDATYPMIGVAAIPGCIGLALIAFGLLAKDRS
jgi:hypothetical protein